MRAAGFLALLALLLGAPADAQDRAFTGGQSARDFQDSVKPVTDSISRLNNRIAEAIEGLTVVAELPTEMEQEEALNRVFLELREQVNDVLAQLASTSEFSRALAQARVSSMELRNWYERQSDDYPNRGGMIERLNQAIGEYDRVEERLEDGRGQANAQLRDIFMKHRVAIQEMKAVHVEEGVRVAQAVVAGLQDLTRSLQDFADSAVRAGGPEIVQ